MVARRRPSAFAPILGAGLLSLDDPTGALVLTARPSLWVRAWVNVMVRGVR